MKGCGWMTYHLTVHTIIIPMSKKTIKLTRERERFRQTDRDRERERERDTHTNNETWGLPRKLTRCIVSYYQISVL